MIQLIKNMRVGSRLFLLAGVLLLALGAVSLASFLSLQTVEKGVTTIYNDRVVPLKQLKVISDMYAVNIVDTSHKVRSGEFTNTEGLKNYEDSKKVIQEQWSSYISTFLTPEEERLKNQAIPLMKAADELTEKLINIVKNNNRGALVRTIETELYPTIDSVSDIFAKLVDLQLDVAKEVHDEAEETTMQAITTSLVITLAAFLVGILLSLFIVKTITGPINQLLAYFKNMAKGDLTQDVQVDSKDEMGMLTQALYDMQEQLSSIIRGVLGNSGALVQAANQLSSTAQSMSQGANEQAASVEETSASLEEMSASISQNAENAKVTNGIANKTAQEANEGGSAVTETVSAMRQIAEKINMVEDIAYNTNLLALNAAIEAARAGEHGKGFAVVASEVRKLAERSQVAAQEIGNLAGGSVQIAEKAGSLLTSIVPNVRKTADLVEEITAASDQQSTGVSQINQSMGQLDKVTAQNASGAEELAATAEELNGQATGLQESMAFFKVSGRASSKAVNTPAAPVAPAAPVVSGNAPPAGVLKPEIPEKAAPKIKSPEQKDFEKF